MADADGVRVRVLHVDDDPEIVDLAATFLRREDDRLEVDAAETADTALERAREGTVDCIVSDYHLPDMDCDEFAATIADIDPDIPFVLFTGRDRTQIDATFLEEGITAYLQKGSGTEQYSRLAREILAAAEGDGKDEIGDTPTENHRTDGGLDRTNGGRTGPDLSDLDIDGPAVVETALDALDSPLVVFDADLTVAYWNRAVPTFTGYGADELGEMDATAFYVPPARDRIEAAIGEAIETGSATVRADLLGPDGGTTPVEVRYSRLGDDADGVAAAFRDRSDHVAYERELEHRRERLEEVVSAVSHDLRNPLNVISGRLVLARETGDEEHFEALDRSTERMERLIDSLVELARKGEPVEHTEQVTLADVAEDAWSAVGIDGGTLSLETDRTLTAEYARLRTVLLELFENAVVHGRTTDDGGDRNGDGAGVTVTVGDLPDGFYVVDDGPGIPEGSRKRFVEFGESTAHDRLGVGLAVVRRLVEAHGWSMELTDGAAGGVRIEVRGVDGSGSPGAGGSTR